jgi:hypothetical protein
MLGSVTAVKLPDDPDELGIEDTAIVNVPAGSFARPVERTDGGVVSLPHGWGHDRSGTRLGIASTQPGVNVNQLNFVRHRLLIGIPVEIMF